VESNKNSIPEKESIKKESSIPKVFKIKSYTKNENNSYEYISY